MKLNNKKIIYAPTDITTFIDSPFASWMDHASLKIPELKDKKTLAKKLKYLSDRGNDFEQETLEKFQKEKDVFIVPEENAFQETIDAMLRGHDVIYQGALKKENFEGYADFLVKSEGKSNLGNHFYEVYDSKLSRLPKAKFIIQLICYDEMLKEIQGDISKHIYVILGTGKTVSFETKKYYDYFETVKEQFISFHNNFDLSKKPIPSLDENFLAWEKEAKRFLHELSDLTLVSGISTDIIKKFREIGINRIEELVNCNEVDFLLPDVFYRLKSQAEVQLLSRYGEEAQIKVINFEKTLQKGLSKIPTPSNFDIFLNIEESMLADKEGMVFHFGYLNNEYYISESNTSKKSEKYKFESFIEKLEKIKFNKIFVYGNKAVEILKRLSAQYNTKTEFIFGLIYKHAFVDIKEVILQSMVIGVESYELRAMRSFFPSIEIEDSNIILEDFEKSKNPKIKKMLLSKISKNSKQKTLAIRVLRDKLIKVREEYNIPFVEFKDTEEGIIYYKEKEEAEKMLELEKDMKQDEDFNVPESKTFEAPPYDVDEYEQLEPSHKLNFLMKQLNNFYDTEDRPSSSERNAKFLGLESDWYEDLECLAYLTKVEQDIKKPQLFKFSFNPLQETKIKVGDSIKVFHNKRINGQVVGLSLTEGFIYISFTKKYIDLIQRRDSISIIGFNTIRKDSLISSIKRILDNFEDNSENCGIPKALYDFLMKKHPDINGVKAGSDLYSEDEDLIKALTRNVLNMNQTTLIVQGPPGTGKTYTCSRVVKTLLEQGKKIAICSNSHKAINNLMAKIAEHVGENYSLIKIESKADPMFELLSNVTVLPDTKKLTKLRYDILGATSFALCKQDFVSAFDYLLIDEAGQFSLANLTSIIPCAKNVVLIGDQAQLEQPISGIHAGESGLSCLEYYVGGTQTISKEYGFFLPISRRMNPKLGDIVSDLFYEGRLKSYQENSKRKLILSKNSIIKKNEGFQFVPSIHEGNIQYSVEEVQSVVDITKNLLKQKIKLFDDEGNLFTKKIEMSDIIFVSPYNLQVTKLKEALGEDANVGSVDLFQGQEAPIVIISLASSKGSSGRGLGFILNKNRMNVALSRGKVLAILVASPDIIKTKVKEIEDLELLDMFCKLTKI